MTGSSGFVGKGLVPYLERREHEVIRLVRSQDNLGDGAVLWNPRKAEIDQGALEGLDAVIHLAGDNLAAGRWTAEKRERIRQSRVVGTEVLAQVLSTLESPPRVFVCASAVGFYGDRGDAILTEDSSAGTGFLAEVCRAWERASRRAEDAGIRVVNVRFGMLLGAGGGALQAMLTPFKLGAGGRIGDGEQYMSWITLEDAMGAIHHALMNDDMSGPVNVVAPNPVQNAMFTKTLGRVLHRPTILPLPAFVARTVLGEMADELLLASQRVHPVKLQASGYQWMHPDLEGALQTILS